MFKSGVLLHDSIQTTMVSNHLRSLEFLIIGFESDNRFRIFNNPCSLPI